MLVVIALWVSVPRTSEMTDSADEMLARAQELIKEGKLEAAQNQLTEGVKEFPGHAAFYDLLGVVHAQQQRYDIAEADFRKAITLTPHFVGAYLNLGHLYQEELARDASARRRALAVYAGLLKIDPDNIEAHYQSAALLEQEGSFQASVNHIEGLPADARKRAPALALLCGDYAGLGKLSQAEAVADELLQSSEVSEIDVASILPVLDAHRHLSLEEHLLQGLVSRGLASSKMLDKLGRTYEGEEKLREARDILERVAQAKPDAVEPLMELARVADRQGDERGALGYLAHARDLQPNLASVHFFFGMACVKLNLAQEAYESLKKAVTLDPENAYYNYAFGALAVQREDPRESIPYFRRYCALRSDDPRGRLALGTAYFYSHDDDAAKKELEPLVQYRATAVGAHYFLGRIANQEGSLGLASRELRQALRLEPNYANARAELGLVEMKQKDYAEAGKSLREALKVEPDNYMANLNLTVLYQRTKDPRAAQQTQRLQQVRSEREQRAKELLRTIVVQRY